MDVMEMESERSDSDCSCSKSSNHESLSKYTTFSLHHSDLSGLLSGIKFVKSSGERDHLHMSLNERPCEVHYK